MMKVTVAFLLCASLSGVALSVPRPTAAGDISWEPYRYETRDGKPVTDGERGRILVPERHADPDGTRIELSFIRFRATTSNPAPPIIWLAGGPGDFGSDDIEGPYLQLVRAFQEVADVIALDQRGTGLSQPLLTCPDNEIDLPTDEPLALDALLEAYRTVSRQCAAYWEEQGVDLSAYNTVESAEDLEDLRRALGAETVSLYGASYGTHLALAALRRHPESIHRAILAGVEGPDQTWKLPSAIETHFAEVARAEGTPEEAPDLLTLLREVTARLDREPVPVDVVEEDGDTVRVVVGGVDLRLANRYFLGGLDNIRNLPAIYQAMAEGDFSLLGRLSLQLRQVSVETAMYYCMDCASGASAARLARIEAESALPLSLTGAALNFPFPGICDAWPARDLGETFRGPLVSDVPVLFLSGTLDGQTPVSNVSELLPGFRRGSHLIVENATHQFLELANPEIQRVMVEFLKGNDPPRPLVISAPDVEFQTKEQGD